MFLVENGSSPNLERMQGKSGCGGAASSPERVDVVSIDASPVQASSLQTKTRNVAWMVRKAVGAAIRWLRSMEQSFGLVRKIFGEDAPTGENGELAATLDLGDVIMDANNNASEFGGSLFAPVFKNTAYLRDGLSDLTDKVGGGAANILVGLVKRLLRAALSKVSVSLHTTYTLLTIGLHTHVCGICHCH